MSRTVFVLDKPVEEDTRHGDGVAREVGVVVHAFTNLETSGRVPVASEESEDVVLHRSVHGQPCHDPERRGLSRTAAP